MTTQLELTALDRAWCDDATEQVRLMIGYGHTFTSDDLYPILGNPPHRNWQGVLFAKLRQAGMIKPTGRYLTSARPSANGRALKEWVMV